MARTVITLEQDSIIELEMVGATLNAKGWDRDEVRLDTRDLKKLSTEETENGIRISCKENLNLWIPHESSLIAERIGGTAIVRNIHGDVSFERVGGSTTVKDAASLSVGQCGGSLSAKNIDGDVTAERVGGSATIKAVAGDVRLSKISGSTNLRNIDGNITVKDASGSFTVRDAGPDIDVECRGNASLHLADIGEGHYTVNASGNVFCHLYGAEDVAISLESGSGDVHLFTDEGIEALHTGKHQFTLGEGEGQLAIKAGGSVTVDTRTSAKGFAFDTDFGEDLAEDFETLADEISEQISGQVESQLESLDEKLESLRARLQAGGLRRSTARRTERRLNAAQRKLHRKLEQSKARAVAKARRRAEPVSEAERLSVLQMVQDKKITVEDAEMLLNALEGRETAAKSPEPPVAPEPPEPAEPAEPAEAPEPPKK